MEAIPPSLDGARSEPGRHSGYQNWACRRQPPSIEDFGHPARLFARIARLLGGPVVLSAEEALRMGMRDLRWHLGESDLATRLTSRWRAVSSDTRAALWYLSLLVIGVGMDW